ncbi:MAG: hypothetical protein JW782_00365 [Candidatus Saganbacteria bacterium]|nr:hypothetical protein [Candidatus Saganbacteria bacterium]
MSDFWTGLSDFGSWVANGFSRSSSTSGCTAEGVIDACAANNYAPEAGSPYAGSSMVEEGDPVTFTLPWAETCQGDSSGLEVVFSLGSIQNRAMTRNSDGSYSITVDAFQWSTEWNAVAITITDLNHGSSITKYMSPPTVVPATDPVDPSDQCADDPNPAVASLNFNLAPGNNININETLLLSVPADMVEECDGSSDSIAVVFNINGMDWETELVTDYYSEALDMTLSGQHYVAEVMFSEVGSQMISAEVRDTSRGTTVSLYSQTVNVGVCYTIPAFGANQQYPDDTSIIRGTDTEFTFLVNDLNDCNGNDLVILDHNVEDLLHNGYVEYTGGTLTVIGQILPSISGGTIRFNLEDINGIPAVYNFYLPTIEPVEIQTTSLFIQEGAEANFVAPTISGATNYRFWVTMPGEIDDLESNQLTGAYSYTPTMAGEHILNLEVTAYNGDIITADYPFIAAEAIGGGDVCYTIPEAGLLQQTPLLSGIVRGDDTFITWTMDDLSDCLGGDLIFYDDNASEILYDEVVSYLSQGLTVSGRVRSTVSSGSHINVRFIDNWGHMKTVSIPVPAISEPFIQTDIDPWITLSEDVDLQLLAEPAGASYNYLVTPPISPAFSSGVLTDSFWTIGSGQTPETGVYTIELDITGGDGETIPVIGSFPVHED